MIEFNAAIHESGHAIIALLTGKSIVQIWVEGHDGGCELAPSPLQIVFSELDVSVRLVRRGLLLDVAGATAEVVHFLQQTDREALKKPIPLSNRLDADGDLKDFREGSDEWYASQSARRIVEVLNLQSGRKASISVSDVLTEIRRAETRAEKLLRRQWEQVRAVAFALFHSDNGRLSGEQVAEAIKNGEGR